MSISAFVGFANSIQSAPPFGSLDCTSLITTGFVTMFNFPFVDVAKSTKSPVPSGILAYTPAA